MLKIDTHTTRKSLKSDSSLRALKNLEVTWYEEHSSNRCPAKKAISYR